MTKTVSVALKAHIAQPYHRLATCWKVTLVGGTVKAFTDHDQDIVFDGVTYLAASGYTASNVASTDAMNVDNLNVDGMLSSPSITEDDLHAGVWDFADVEVFLVNWSDLTQGRIIQRVGKLGEVSVDRSTFSAEIRGLMQAYARVVGQLTGPACRASLGDSRCGVDLGPLTETGTITGVNDDGITLYDTARTEPGPTGGYDIYSIVATNPLQITFETPAGGSSLHDGATVVISGVGGMPEINTIALIRDFSSNDIYSSFYIGVDGTVLGTWDGNGTITPLGAESGYFDFGVITFTSGANDGLSMEIKQYSEGQMTLALPMPYAVEVGDTYSIVPGCNKALATCRDTYDNVVNFRGEPYLPGVDQVMQVGRRG
jgi:hypothetical protein